ncbi:hypothetical protein TREES_T100018449 [Tupaia chinensis]|uniref:Uncharacterized protein n=1 Tax=Tupaia chinensis TaxID=246437 RepID=L9KY50_TUPCH|nr:hypothetical protein TREES_T100018449 [Tupaia chinensis]
MRSVFDLCPSSELGCQLLTQVALPAPGQASPPGLAPHCGGRQALSTSSMDALLGCPFITSDRSIAVPLAGPGLSSRDGTPWEELQREFKSGIIRLQIPPPKEKDQAEDLLAAGAQVPVPDDRVLLTH